MIAKNRDGSDVAKVVDFGIAKAHSSDAQKVTKTGLVVGTPEYMSPEQLAGDKLDGRSDIYSLALVAFNCLTGKLPFPADSAQEAMIARLVEQPKTLAEMRPDVAWPAEVQAVMDKALARDANERYQSAAQFGRELWAACESMPASQAAEAGTQVLSAPASTAANLPKTRVAGPGEGGRTVAAPASKAATPPAAATTPPVKKSNTAMIAAAVIGIAVLGGGGYVMLGGKGGDAATSAESTALTQAPASQPQTAAPSGAPASPAGGTTELKTPVNPAGGGSRTQGTQAAPVAPPSAPAAGGGAALVAKWMPSQDDLTRTTAQQLVNELEGVIPTLAGETKGNAYYLVGRAYHKLDNVPDACNMMEKAKPLVRGATLSVVNLTIESICP
ncbi:MAG: serine/threonine protein kinase, partial [Gemmatimonadaceae bacterium]|nr:serine/threonine protein kinase [Gemmatimonadaceae bacterium]